MKYKVIMKTLSIAIFLGWQCFFYPAFAQEGASSFQLALEDDQTTIEALALYPEDLRIVIMEVAAWPELLVRLENIQNSASSLFKSLIIAYPEETQKHFYELGRFPDLIEVLGMNTPPSKREIQDVLMDVPEELHPIALDFGRNEHATFKKINDLQLSSELAYAKLVANYPPQVSRAVNQLIQLPEVLDILMEDFRTTVLIGSLYAADAEKILYQMDSLHLILARRNAEELADWKKELEENPEALQELEAAAKTYAEEQGQDPKVYRSPVEDGEDVYIKVYHNYHPYSFWFGYPWWYSAAYWYPRPLWYDWGFWYGPGGAITIISLPSWNFIHWHFYYSRHHYFYPHLSHFYIRHYERHPYSAYRSTHRIHQWVAGQREVFSRDWLADDGRRPSRIREYGRLNDRYDKYVRKRPFQEVVSRDVYFERNRKAYPNLAKAQRLTPNRTAVRTVPPKSTTSPPIFRQPTSSYDPIRTKIPRRSRPNFENKVYQQKSSRPVRVSTYPSSRNRQIDIGRSLHKKNWNKTRVRSTRSLPATTRKRSSGGSIKPTVRRRP